MENNQHQEVSFEQLVEMADFSFDDKKVEPETVITLEQEEDKVIDDNTTPQLEEKKEEDAPITLDNNNADNRAQYLKDRIESGDIEDALITIEGEEKKLSELDYLDDETYKAVLEDDKKFKKEQLKEKYVSVDGLSETQKTLIEIVKSGDLDKAKELFEKPESLVEPFQGYDSDNDAHNEQVLRWYYDQQGHSPKQIEALVKGDKEDLALDSKAEQIVNFQKQQFKQKLTQEATNLAQEKIQEQEKIKSYKKDLSKEFKEAGILEDSVVKKYVEVATRYTNDGELEVDSIYQKMMDDPKQAKDLIHFMLDKENYLKTVSATVKKETQKSLLRQVNIIRDTSKTTQSSESTNDKPKSDLEKLEFN
jgi:hypothetical protein